MIGSTNVALNALATQYNTWTTTNASLAVDGSLAIHSCTSYVIGIYHWWTVDLGYHVNVVQVAGQVNPSYREYCVLLTTKG